MADQKISQLTELTSADDADVLPIVDTSVTATKKITWSNIKAVLKTYFDGLYNLYVHPNHSGDVTSVADGAQTIANKAVTLAKMNDLAQSTIIGRVTASTGVPEALSATNVRTIINVADGATANAKATSAEVTTGTDDVKFATPKAIKDAGIVAVTLPVKATGAELDTGTDDAKFATAKALADSSYIKDIVEDTTPQLGGELDTNNKSINRKSIPGADNTGEGDIVGDINAGETVAFPNILYLKSDGKWWLADADAIASCGLLAIALESKNADQAVKVLLRGFIRDDDWAWTVAGPIYASVTAGALSQTAPTGEDDVVVPVGYATHADRMYFCPDMTRAEYKA